MAGCWLQQPSCIKLHKYEEIIKKSVSEIDTSCQSNIYKKLKAGIFLDEMKQKYWVDKKCKNCFMIFANGLKIEHGNDNLYWSWYEEEMRGGRIKVAELKGVYWLKAKGTLDAAWLSPGVTYEVAFLIKLRANAFGWETPVHLELKLPHFRELRRKEIRLHDLERETWHRILLGEFKTSPGNNQGEIGFSLYETKVKHKKGGLLIRGVIIQPKTTNYCICPKDNNLKWN